MDRSDTSYVAERLKNPDVPGCLFGDKIATELGGGLGIESFSAAPDCSVRKAYMCETSPCSVCDTCVSNMFKVGFAHVGQKERCTCSLFE